MSLPDLDVVVIARNEAALIEKCLRSTLHAAHRAVEAGVVATANVTLVDSASTDGTVEIARQFPVRIIELPAHWPLSAAAGIHCGYRDCTAELFAVMDGDVECDPDWFTKAIPFLLADEMAANVYGWWEEASQGSGRMLRHAVEMMQSDRPATVSEAEFTGNGIFRREALKAVGGHNPFLKGAEDKDISFRLRQAGYRLLRVPVQIGIHDWQFDPRTYYDSVRAWSVGDGHGASYAEQSGNAELADMFRSDYDPRTLMRVLRQAALMLATVVFLPLGLVWPPAFWLAGLTAAMLLAQFVIGFVRQDLPLPEYSYHWLNRIPYVVFRHWHFHRGRKMPTPDPATYPRA